MTDAVTPVDISRSVRKPHDDEFGFMYFGEHLYYTGKYGDAVIVRRPHLGGCLASDLEVALALNTEPNEIFVTDDDDDNYSEDESGVLPVRFGIHDSFVHLLVEFRIPPWAWDADDEAEEIRTLIDPLLSAHELTFQGLEIMSHKIGILCLGFSPRDRLLSDLLSAGEDVCALLDASNSGALTLKTATYLVKSGRVAALIGQPEGKWFDAKESHYNFKTAIGKISLAQSVARFCNGTGGGIVVVGVRTQKSSGSDVVDKLTPLALDLGEEFRYRQIIDAHLYPFVVDLDVTAVPTADGSAMFVLIEVPPQPEYNKPYLVHGAVIEEKALGAFISVVQRRDENSEPYTAAMIHAWIATGRALIQRGELPGAK